MSRDSMALMTIRELLKVSSDYLEKKRIGQPRLSAEVLLAHNLGVERLDLYLNSEKPLEKDEIGAFRNLIRRRAAREPLQYITGHQEFRSMPFSVGPGVLIPRPETELLVERVLERLSGQSLPIPAKVLDLGTGSGVIAVSLAEALPGARIFATDISLDALAYARKNAASNGLAERIALLAGEWLEPFSAGKTAFQAIVANPPYVAASEWGELQPEVRDHEPQKALTAGEDGMAEIRRIISSAADHLAPGGWLFVETAPWQTGGVVELMAGTGRFSDCTRSRDHAGRYRVVEARLAFQ